MDFDRDNGHSGEQPCQDSSSHDMRHERHVSESLRTTNPFAEELPDDHLNAENHAHFFLSNDEVKNSTFPMPSSEAFITEQAGQPPGEPEPDDGELVAKKNLLANLLQVDDLERVLQAQRLPPARGTHDSAHPTGPSQRHVLGYYACGGFHGICRGTAKHPWLCRFLNAFFQEQALRQNLDAGKWSSFSILYNGNTEVHTDKNNLRGSYNRIIRCGDYVNGQLWIGHPDGDTWRRGPQGEELRGVLVDSHNHLTEFDSRSRHAVEPWKGHAMVGHRLLLSGDPGSYKRRTTPAP